MKKTNYDKIKEMTFEELASFLNHMINEGDRMMDNELEANGIVDDENRPWSGKEEVALWLNLEIKN